MNHSSSITTVGDNNTHLRRQFVNQICCFPWFNSSLCPCGGGGFVGGSGGKESGCNAGDLGSIPGSGRSPGEGNWLPSPVFWPGEFHRLHKWGCKELGMIEWLSFSLFLSISLWRQSIFLTVTYEAFISLCTCCSLFLLLSSESWWLPHT